jgi:hypothetical protein
MAHEAAGANESDLAHGLKSFGESSGLGPTLLADRAAG